MKNYFYLLKDIRFWILFFLIVRLYGITNAPLEPASTWRQTDVLMIARNFYDNNANILYPTVDLAADKPGFVGCEFPILNYLIYVFSLIFGFGDWYGRLINLVLSSVGVFFFYKIIRKYFGEPPAFNASVVLLVSMWFAYSRITIPDIFATSLCMISLFYGFEFLERGTLSQFLLFFILGLIGCLSKISSATILTALAIPFFRTEIPVKRKTIFTLGSAIILSVVYGWYFTWVPHLNSIGFPNHFFMGMPLLEGASELIDDLPSALAQFYDTPLKFTGFAAFVFAMVMSIKQKSYVALAAFALTFGSFLIIAIKSGKWFYINGYYPLVAVPSMAFLTGYGISFLKENVVIAVLLIVGLEGIGNQFHVFQIRQPYKSLESLEANLINASCGPDDLIVINADKTHNPIPMYFAHRKGRNIPNGYLANAEYVVSLRSMGFKYIVILKQIFGTDIQIDLPRVYDSEYYSIYSLKK